MDVQAIRPTPNGFGDGAFGHRDAKRSNSASEANGQPDESRGIQADSTPHIILPTEGNAEFQAMEGQPGVATDGDERSIDALREQIEGLVDAVNEKLQSMPETSIQFLIDNDSGDVIVQIVDVKTDEVIRQIPPEEVLQISERLDELKGLILDRSV